MSCNCKGNNGNGMSAIPHVQGNVLRLAIVLQVEIVTCFEGKVEKTYTDFIPTGSVKVVLAKGYHAYEFAATMQGNVAMLEDKGTLPVGVYSITVLCRDENGNPMRFKQDGVVSVYDATCEAGIPEGIEFSSETHWLTGAVFIAYGGGGITNESDPVFGASPAAGITAEDIARWNAGSSGGSGYNVSYANGVLTFTGAQQPTYNNGILTL